MVHKDKIGQEGRILLSRLTLDGQELWRLETNLKALLDWQVLSDRLLLFGNDNPELTSSECNLLYSIHPTTGQASLYDYFQDKVRK